jgi:exosortase
VQEGSAKQLDIRTVVLVGGRDFGRCPLAADLPAALWPIADQSALQRLLNHLAEEGIAEAIVCCGKEIRALVEAVCRDSRLKVNLAVEELTSGTAGCLRDAVGTDPGDLLLVFSGSMVSPPPITGLIEAHRARGAELSVVFNPGRERGSSLGPPAEIYLCRPTVLRHVPDRGYSDVKEGLIPALLRAGGTVYPLVLEREVGNFRDRAGYLDALELFFQTGGDGDRSGVAYECAADQLVLKGADVSVHPAARICGPVVIGDGAQIGAGALVIGPAMIGREVRLGENSVVVRSALWDGVEVGAGGEVHESILGSGTAIRDGVQVVERAVCAARTGRGSKDLWDERVPRRLQEGWETMQSYFDRWAARLPAWAPRSSRQLQYLLTGIVILFVFCWSYGPTLRELVAVWLRSDEYSSGLLVPPLAAYVLWSRRRDFASALPRPALRAGVALFLLAQVIRIAGLCFMFQSAERLSLMLALAALVLLVLGWKYLGRLATVLLFLCLMLPWPNRIQTAVTLPLQRWSTSSAVFCLELAGYDILRDGNVIHIGDASVAVAEACNGLRMITAFFVISGLVVLLVKRAWWEKLVILASSLPIALLCNTLRLAITAVAFTIVKGEAWEKGFHAGGGYAMMPLALALVVAELWLLTQLTTPPRETKPAIISRRSAQRIPDP